MWRFSKRICILMILVLVAALGAACGDDEPEATGGAGADNGETRSVLFGAATCSAYYYQFHLGFELGFFEEEGLDVDMQCIDGSSAVAQQLAAGNIELGGSGSAAVLPLYERAQPVYPFFMTDYGLAYDIIVPTDSEIQEVADLAGRPIGVSELSGAEVPVIRALFADAGLDPEGDANLIEVGADPGGVQIALERGSIEAVGATAGDLGALYAIGLDARSIISDEAKEELSRFPAGALYATEDVKDDTEMLGRFGRAAAKGFLVAYTNPEATLCILADVIPEEFVDPDIGRASFEGALEFTTAPQNPDGTYEFSAGNDDVELWNNYIELYANGGVLDEPFDMEPYIVDVNDQINDFDQEEVAEFARGLDSDC